MARPKLGYLLFDLPSDHEVEGSLATECASIYALIQGDREIASRVKRVCVASQERFMAPQTYRYEVQFVHLACHGAPDGIEMLGGTVPWCDAAQEITRYLRPLRKGGKRVICLSCCYSSHGVDATESILAEYFTGVYFFVEDKIPFSTAMTTWTMFYLMKSLSRPQGAIVKAINRFMDDKVIAFRKY